MDTPGTVSLCCAKPMPRPYSPAKYLKLTKGCAEKDREDSIELDIPLVKAIFAPGLIKAERSTCLFLTKLMLIFQMVLLHF